MNIHISPTEEKDLNFVVEQEQHPDNRDFIIPWDINHHRHSLQNDNTYHAIAWRSGVPMGFIILSGLMNPHHSIELKRIVVAEKGKGIGRYILEWAKNFSFKEIKANRLWLDVKEQNLRAKNLYLDVGFQEEGILRECLLGKNGYESLIVLSLLRSDMIV